MFLVLDGVEHEMAVKNSTVDEEDMEKMMSVFAKSESFWVGLTSGNCIAIPQESFNRVHFLAKPITE